MIKAPPPFSPVIYGNFHIFPSPTAEPLAARINAVLEDHSPCEDVRSITIICDIYCVKINNMNQVVKNTEKIISVNKKASRDYFIQDTIETGIVLHGWEVKSIRLSKVQLRDAYIRVIKGDIFLVSSHISPISTTNNADEVDSMRIRKLLLHKKQISEIIGKIKIDGMTIVPISMYWKNNKIKLKIGYAKGKKKHDKRQVSKDRDWSIKKKRILKNRI
tara:strand:+ start:464 stop:1117 length:654 start_codon:yes stop_codon:yes gene_type:complete